PWASKARAWGLVSPVRVAVGVVGMAAGRAPTKAGSALVSKSMSAPRRVMASRPALSDTTVAPLAINSSPPLALPVPSALTPARQRRGARPRIDGRVAPPRQRPGRFQAHVATARASVRGIQAAGHGDDAGAGGDVARAAERIRDDAEGEGVARQHGRKGGDVV